MREKNKWDWPVAREVNQENVHLRKCKNCNHEFYGSKYGSFCYRCYEASGVKFRRVRFWAKVKRWFRLTLKTSNNRHYGSTM